MSARCRPAVLALMVLLMITQCTGQGKRDPASGRIRVLYVGEPTGVSPYPILEADPLMWPYPVKASTVVFSFEIARRSMRQYMPRTYDDLASYQVFILSDANAAIFTPSQLKWYADAVEAGSGLVMIGGNEAFGGRGGHLNWGTTAVGNVLPVECLDEQWTEGRVEITQPLNPLVASLPIEANLPWMRGYDGNKIEVREGAEELARLIQMPAGHNTFWATWVFGSGRTFAMAGDWTPAGGVVFLRWEYYGDFATNLMLYLSDNDLPEDLETLHEARTKFAEYRSSKAYLLNIMDFGESFGANMDPVFDMIEEADSVQKEATAAYLDLEYQQTLGLLDDALGKLESSVDRAMRLKDQALIWIFVIEWTTVMGTFAVCGFVLWTLMVRRKLYRESATTRFAR